MAGAKSSSHVPKFGNWDSDDVPYTICFENARELRAAGVDFDPNDPDTYPPAAVINQNSTPADHRGDYHQRREMGNSGSEKLSSERSGSDYALLKEAKQSGRKKKHSNGAEGMSRFTPTTTVSGHGGKGNRNPRVRRNDEGEMMASVPKFGSWDVRDPKSGDGYTAIFNKVKIEKQIGGSNNPQAVPPLMNQTKKLPIAQTTTTATTHGSNSFVSKICCCLCPK
ncbi:RPM1-interacting protein 4-like isoform X2 [Benincasa hispida]|uniref:RPM1-interacting protein 4-like isoform X2 n=1 Tax=Benincasa hispida TaxID=102211 RepID=UPI0019010925|nr:RPM1-interacting protein 4-like isoform X2 [Benincasa hispida]